MLPVVALALYLFTGPACAPGAPPAAGPTPRVGDTVWAEWLPNAWYHGKADSKCPVGMHVAYDDGDQADRAFARIAVDLAPDKGDVRVGTHLLALWSDGRMYPGTVTGAAGGMYDITFDDGGTRTVGLDDLRLIAAAPNPGKRPAVGATVWAEWLPNAWYHGKTDRRCPVGLHVAFDDGDEANRAFARIAVDRAPAREDVRVGTHLLALWSNDRMYPGTITRAAGGQYDITFDDGGTRTVGLGDLRLIPE